MKILQINSVCGTGSTGRITTDIHQVLKEQGYISYVAYGRGKPENCVDSIRIGNDLDIYNHVALTRFFDRHGFGSKEATKKFIKRIEEINPDVFHLHNIHGYYINIELLFKYLKISGKKVIWTLHDCWAFTGHCAHFEYIGCYKWKSQCENCPQKNRYPRSILKDNSYANFNVKKELFTGIQNMRIVTPSKWLAYLVKESFLKDYDIQVINNGIDLNFFKPVDGSEFRKKYNLINKFFILGVASIWDERKGLKFFVELSKKLEGRFKIVIVGLNDKQLKKIPKSIIGIKRTNSINELVEIYSSADLFLNPTLEDNFPTVNLEALACGTPVVTFNTGGSGESIDNSCGSIIRKNSLNEVINEIYKFSLNLVDKEKCVKQAKKFNKKEIFLEYLKIYNSFTN